MKWNKVLSVLSALLAAGLHTGRAQFDSGSTGTVALVLAAGTTLTSDLPPDGVLHYTTITIGNNATLRFRNNALNTPVYLLARGNVVIDGTIDVSGRGAGTNAFVGGEPGPGGFAGGEPGFLVQAGPPVTATGGSGLGPGGGQDIAGRRDGYYAFTNTFDVTNTGYGYAHLIPLAGGSGGCGASNAIAGGGGGGGGAILISSSTRIQINASGKILANGGPRDAVVFRSGYGSAGAIRLVAPMVLGSGTLDVRGDPSTGTATLRGRIRIDSVLRYDPADPTNPTNRFSITAAGPIAGANQSNPDDRVWSVGTTMIVFPTNQPRLDIVQVGTNSIPQGASNPVSITLPPNANTNQLVIVRASGFNANVPIRLVVTPENGYHATFGITIDNSAGGSADGQANVSLPVNMRAFIHAWTTP